jgi:cysteine desulfurase / selenocysteine lyase
MFERVEAARARYASLIRAEPDEIAMTKNVSDGINAFASALPWGEGDNVVICEALEHPANIFPWRNLERLRGVRLKPVQPEAGHIPLERLIEAIDGRTRVVAVSSVSFSPGFRFPVAELGAHCRARGVLLLVDGAQSIGILDTDVKALGVDALAGSTQKGLLSLYGGGFLYVRREVAESLQPVYLSRLGVRVASGHEASMGDAAGFEYATGARRFDVGNHNFLAAIAVEQALAMIESVGIQAVEAHACGLARRLAEGLAEAGLPVFGDPADPARTHIVSVGRELSDEHDMTQDSDMIGLHAWLSENKVRFTIRRGMLRFSHHLYNNADDVERVIALAQQWNGRGRSAKA